MKRLIITIAVTAMTLLSTHAQEVIDIQYNGNTAKVSIPTAIGDVTSKVEGANVTLTSATTSDEYIYRVRGKSTNGSLTIKGSYKLTLQLAGVELTNQHYGAAIDIDCGKRIAVVLEEGTVNRLADSPGGTHKGAIHFKGHPEFEGGGTLFVTGKTKHAIDAKEYLEIKASTGTINILGAVSDGIHCGKGNPSNEHNYFLMKGKLINRGVLHGPWLPIYGVGGLIVLTLLTRVRKRPFIFFVSAVTLCGTVEYFTGWALEEIFGAQWWNYDGYFLNLHGRICAEGLFVFGICALAFIYVLAPLLDNMIRKINRRVLLPLALTLLLVLAADIVYSKMVPNTGYGITGNFDQDEDPVAIETVIEETV